MPRSKKDGSRAVDKPAAVAAAQAHRSFASELDGLIGEATAHVPDLARYRAEPDRLGRLLGDLIEQHRLLLHALRDLADEHDDQADDWQSAAASIKPGKPTKAKPTGMLAQVRPLEATLREAPAKATGKGPAFYRAVYRKVELRRAELQQAGKPQTIAAALRSLLLEVAGRKNLNASKAEASYTRYRAAYGRGRNLVLGE